MTDFDPDTYLQGDHSTSTAFDPDAYLSQPASPTSTESPKKREDLFVGMGKYIAGTVAHAAGNLADVVTGTSPGEGSHAQRWASPFASDDPRSQLDPDQVKVMNGISRAYDTVAGTGPAATEIKTRIPQALEAISTVVPVIRGVGGGLGAAAAEAPLSAQEVLARNAQESPQSMGAASAAPRMTNVSPELQQAVTDAARQTGGAVNPEVLNRHIEADSLPVKVQLTPGQASQNPGMISAEMNNRGRIAGLPEMLNEQNKRLTQNVQAIRDRVGPDVFSANPVEHGDTLIQSYKDKAAVADADIGQKYQALRDAAGGNFPVSAPTLLKNATSALNQELLLDHAPKSIMSTLGRLADSDNMTYQNFESLRTNLARISRSSTDGNERAAAGVIRSAMEELPLKPGAAELKPLADTARSAARAQFQALDADPAYKAAVNESVPPDRFVQRYVIGAPRDQVALMRENLKDNPTATQTMGVAALDHLRQSAGIDPMGNGTFSQAGFNKHLQALSPKLGSLLDPQTIEHLETLGNVARYTQAQPKGSFVNNSNTLVGALASHAANVAEGGANVAAKGFPIGTIARKVIQNRADAKAAKQILKPYGGLTDLPEKPE